MNRVFVILGCLLALVISLSGEKTEATTILSSGSVASGNLRLSVLNGIAFVDFSSADSLTPYLGRKLTITDSAGKKLLGYIKAAGHGEELSVNGLIHNGEFDKNTTDWTSGRAATLTSVAGGQSGNCLQVANTGANWGSGIQNPAATNGAAYKVTYYTKKGTAAHTKVQIGTAASRATYVNQTYTDADWIQKTHYICSIATDIKLTFHHSNVNGETSLWDTVSIRQVTAPSPTGVTIVSTSLGTTYNWTSEEPGFNRNDSDHYTYTIESEGPTTFYIGSHVTDNYTSWTALQAAIPEVAGDTVSFRRGESFKEIVIVPHSGSPGNEIIYTAHGTGNNPIIDSAKWLCNTGGTEDRKVGTDPATTWVEQGGGIYMTRAPIGTTETYSYSDAKLALEDGKIITRGSAKEILKPGQYFHAWECPNWNMYYYPSTGLPSAHRFEYGYYATGMWVNAKSYLTIEDLAFRGSNRTSSTIAAIGGIGLENSRFITIQKVESYNHAYHGIFICNSDDITVTQNTLRNNNCFGLYANNGCNRVTVTYNNVYSNTAVNSNNFPTDRGSGIAFGGSTIHDSITITANDIHSNGYSGISGGDVALYVAARNLIISRNKIHDNLVAPVALWGSNTFGDIPGNFTDNLVYNNTFQAGDAGALIIRSASSLNVCNNTFHGNYPSANYKSGGIYVYCNDAAGSIRNLVVKNNIFSLNQNKLYTIYQVAFDVENRTPDTTGTVFDNNLFYTTANTTTIMRHINNTYAFDHIKGQGYGYWQTDMGWEGSSIWGDPLFVDASSGNFSLQECSPCINAGSIVTTVHGAAAIDYAGTPILMLPDIGAYEYPQIPQCLNYNIGSIENETHNYPFSAPADYLFNNASGRQLIELPILENNVLHVDSFVASPTSGAAPLVVTFSAITHDPDDSSIESYQLDVIGRSACTIRSEDNTIQHQFILPGIYQVVLTVTDDEGGTAASEPITITAMPAEPVSLHIPTQTFVAPDSVASSEDITQTMLINRLDEETSVTVSALDTSGDAIAEQTFQIPAGGKQLLDLTAFEDLEHENLQAWVDRTAVLFTDITTDKARMSAWLSTEPKCRLFVPHIAEDTHYWKSIAYLSLADVNPQKNVIALQGGDFWSDFEAKASQYIDLGAKISKSTDTSSCWAQLDVIPPTSSNDANLLSGFEMFTTNGSDSAGVDLAGKPSKVLYIPHIPMSTETSWVGLALLNPTANDVTAEVRFFNEWGESLTASPLSIPAYSKVAGLTGDLFAEAANAAAWGIIDADGELVGIELRGTDNGGICGFSLNGEADIEGMLPMVESGEGLWSEVIITNPSGLSASLNMDLVAADGTVKTSVPRIIGPKQQLSELVADLFPVAILEDTDYVRFTSDVALTGVQVAGDFERTWLKALEVAH